MTDARMPSEPRGDSGDGPLDDLVALEAPPLDKTTRDRIESGLRVQHAARRGPAPRVAGRPRWALVAPVVGSRIDDRAGEPPNIVIS